MPFFLAVEHVDMVDGFGGNNFGEVHAVVERVVCHMGDAGGEHDAAQVAAVVEAGLISYSAMIFCYFYNH